MRKALDDLFYSNAMESMEDFERNSPELAREERESRGALALALGGRNEELLIAYDDARCNTEEAYRLRAFRKGFSTALRLLAEGLVEP